MVSIVTLCNLLFSTYHSSAPRDDPIGKKAARKQRSKDGVFLHPRPVEWVIGILGWLWDKDDTVFVGLQVAGLLSSFIIASNDVLFDDVFAMVQLVVDVSDDSFALFCDLRHDQDAECKMWCGRFRNFEEGRGNLEVITDVLIRNVEAALTRSQASKIIVEISTK
jgi:hypothetical protein